jgi:serine protease Do
MEEFNNQPYYRSPSYGGYDNAPRRPGYALLIIVALVSALLGGIGAAYLGPAYLYGRLLPWPRGTVQQPGYQLPKISGDDLAELAAQGVVAQVAAQVGPSVVGITSSRIVQSWFNVYENQAVGSGVIFDPAGYIVTNEHVVADAMELVVTLDPGVEVPATLVGADKVTDLAVLKIDPAALPDEYRNLPVAQFGDSDAVKVGQLAIAIGNPLGLQFQRSTTAGIISAVNRDLQMEGVQLRLLQTDAAINSGNSGGALLDRNGLVIGINQAKIQMTGVEGMGFAIPINAARPVIEQLIQNGRVIRPYLGVHIDLEITAQYNRYYNFGTDSGIRIAQVQPAGPAALAGLRSGDIITHLDGQEVKTFNDLQRILFDKSIGEQVEVCFIRNRQPQTVLVKLVATP